MDRTIDPVGIESAEDIPPRAIPLGPAEEGKPAEKQTEDLVDPCPETVEELIPWARKQFPQVSPRTSDPRVIDACIARAAINDFIDHVESALEAARESDKEAHSE